MTCAFVSRALATISAGRLADAVIGHLHADVAGAQRDLLGAVGMAVEAGLADDEARRLAELLGEVGDKQAHVALDLRRGSRAVTPVGARYSPKTAPQRLAPLAGGDAGLGGSDRGRHDVAALAGGGLERVERRIDGLAVARGAPAADVDGRFHLDRLGHGEDGALGGGQRRGLASRSSG